MSEHYSLFLEPFRHPFLSLRDRWWRWRMNPGGEACGAWIRVVRDCWIADLKTLDYGSEDMGDSSAQALDSIYGFMVAQGWMEIDEGAADGTTLPLQPYPEPTS